MKIGIIGSGFGLYGLLPAFNSIKNCRVTCICGKKTERLMTYCESIGLTKIYSNWKEMLESEDLDALALAVTPEAQYEIAKIAMSKGINVFAEKPLAATYKQAEELLFIAKKNKIITAVDFIFPEISEWQKVKQLLDDKVYGNLKNISVDWDFLSYDIKNKIKSWKTNTKEGGGVLSFYSSHVLYYLEYYAGKIDKISSNFSYSYEQEKRKVENGIDMVLRFKNGVSGQVHVCSKVVGMNKHCLTFICEKATLVLENNIGITENFTITVYEQKNSSKILVKKIKNLKGDEDERVKVVKKLAGKFIEGCKNKKQVKPSFVDGVRVQKLIDMARDAKI